jgi:hypothetical protein
MKELEELEKLHSDFKNNLPEAIEYSKLLKHIERPWHLIIKYKTGGVTSVSGHDLIAKYLKKTYTA